TRGRSPGEKARRSSRARSERPTSARNGDMAPRYAQLPALSRLLHWTMAAMILSMLGIGVGMVASIGDYHVLVSIHRPLGIAVLILAVIRLVNRRINPPPPFPPTMSPLERRMATASERAMYGFMLALPLLAHVILSPATSPFLLHRS